MDHIYQLAYGQMRVLQRGGREMIVSKSGPMFPSVTLTPDPTFEDWDAQDWKQKDPPQ